MILYVFIFHADTILFKNYINMYTYNDVGSAIINLFKINKTWKIDVNKSRISAEFIFWTDISLQLYSTIVSIFCYRWLQARWVQRFSQLCYLEYSWTMELALICLFFNFNLISSTAFIFIPDICLLLAFFKSYFVS